MVSASKVTSVEQLRKEVAGSVITRDDAGYEEARRAWDLTLNHYPALIVVAKDAQDIMAAVRFARESNLASPCNRPGMGCSIPPTITC